MSMDYSQSFNLVPVQTKEKKKKLKKKIEKIGYDTKDQELNALMERKKTLLKQKLTNDKKAELKKEISNLENNKPTLRNKIANFLSPQANEKRKKYFNDHKPKRGSMDDLNKALKPLMDL